MRKIRFLGMALLFFCGASIPIQAAHPFVMDDAGVVA